MRERKRQRRTIIIVFVAVICACLAMITTSHKSSVINAQAEPDELTLPIVRYATRKNINGEDQIKRVARNKRYDHQSGEPIKEAAYPVERVWSNHWARGLPALPIRESETVLIGAVTDAKAFMSDDDTGVYSEFTVQVEEVL